MKKLEVSTLDDLDTVLRVGRTMFELKGKLEVTIRPWKIDRSAAQNSLLWLWMSEIGGFVGEPKERMHIIYKEKFLIGIFVRDEPDFAEMAQAINKVKVADSASYKTIRAQVIELVSTTKCSVPQMREYLSSIKLHAATELNFNVSLPELKGLI